MPGHVTVQTAMHQLQQILTSPYKKAHLGHSQSGANHPQKSASAQLAAAPAAGPSYGVVHACCGPEMSHHSQVEHPR